LLVFQSLLSLSARIEHQCFSLFINVGLWTGDAAMCESRALLRISAPTDADKTRLSTVGYCAFSLLVSFSMEAFLAAFSVCLRTWRKNHVIQITREKQRGVHKQLLDREGFLFFGQVDHCGRKIEIKSSAMFFVSFVLFDTPPQKKM
jgi:hypothetical protein